MVDQKLEHVLREHLPDIDSAEPLDPGSALIELGVDSLRLVEFIVALEDSFDIVIPDEEMLAENFDTIGSVSSLVSRLLAAVAKG